MKMGPTTTARGAVQERHGVDEQSPPDEDLSEVVGWRE